MLLKNIRKFDPIIIVLMVAFLAISTLLTYSATLNDEKIQIGAIKIIIIYTASFLAFFAAGLFDYRTLLKTSFYLYGLGILLLVGIFAFGAVQNGAKGWYKIPGGLDLQPAEIMKLFLIIAITYVISQKNKNTLRLTKDVLPIFGLVFVPFLLVIMQPDLGNAVIYVAILLGMLWIGNMKYTHTLLGTVIFVGGLTLFLLVYTSYHDAIIPLLDKWGVGHWASRLDAYIDPSKATKDQIYHVKQAKMAVASGGLYGEGFLRGTSVHAGFIPYSYSDSIFVVVAEEFGFMGSAALLLLYFTLIYRMILIAINCRTMSGSLIVTGILSMFIFQIFENVGMMLGILPLTGITLPFISYGGTSLLINMISMGLAMSVKVHSAESDSAYPSV
ncbi:FtsW/RodA/SpoVE family cell cycle protein [Paenibacillus sp. SI8]|uniref:FtsW/RodA/SpoVE family cell cycle protein n=1 Tax=unclassified Paenibacillus TaxID=185978 RepID=UPI003466054E